MSVHAEEIGSITNLGLLAMIIAQEQMEYWYDPCGKSGYKLNSDLTEKSELAIKRIDKLLTDGGAT